MPLPLFDRTRLYGDATAIVDIDGNYSYADLHEASDRLAAKILGEKTDLEESRIAFLVEPGFANVVAQWSIWKAGGMAVPLGMMHPLPELEYIINDTQACTLIAGPKHHEAAQQLAQSNELHQIKFQHMNELVTEDRTGLPSFNSDRRAMILYTSGTTSRPKGVVSTHANIAAQVEALVSAWGWTKDDSILHVLPLHHVHGIINVLTCALWSGATCEFLNPFDPHRVWERFSESSLSLFMAVPTIYGKLIRYWENAPPDEQARLSSGCRSMRLMVSGSAALPVATLQRWREITGHVLLERYGMTEIGMALSNPLDGERVPGHVGKPLPGVEIRRVDRQGNPLADEMPGEIQVRGPSVFDEYWQRPQETRESFDGSWFRTGDVAIVNRDGVYQILGRSSVDIIKTGGYKVSALEIEEVLRSHPSIGDCAVVGVPDEEWGESVSACVVTNGTETIRLDEFRDWAKDRLAVYKVPRQLIIVDELPRNAMGKVQKPAIKKLFEIQE